MIAAHIQVVLNVFRVLFRVTGVLVAIDALMTPEKTVEMIF
jgi:hypothetical protein